MRLLMCSKGEISLVFSLVRSSSVYWCTLCRRHLFVVLKAKWSHPKKPETPRWTTGIAVNSTSRGELPIRANNSPITLTHFGSHFSEISLQKSLKHIVSTKKIKWSFMGIFTFLYRLAFFRLLLVTCYSSVWVHSFDDIKPVLFSECKSL